MEGCMESQVIPSDTQSAADLLVEIGKGCGTIRYREMVMEVLQLIYYKKTPELVASYLEKCRLEAEALEATPVDPSWRGLYVWSDESIPEFVEMHHWDGFLIEAAVGLDEHDLRAANRHLYIFVDPGDGSRTLMVSIQSSEWREDSIKLNGFMQDWIYPKFEDSSYALHIGFRIDPIG